jgi:hypothetical protein
MPRQSRPKVFLSDEAVLPDDVLPSRLATPEVAGDPDEEQPYNPIPKRPGEGPDPSRRDEPNPDEPDEDDPNPDDVDGDEEDAENTPVPDAPATEQPANPPQSPAGSTAPTPPRLGSGYSAPVSASSASPTVTYRSRISVVEAWRYPGQLANAPDFIDRGWTAWADTDLYGSPAGPALKVPVTRSLSGPTPPDNYKMARVGDYVVRQMVTLVDGLDAEESLDVWPKEAFERLFMPISSSKKRKSSVPVSHGQVAA